VIQLNVISYSTSVWESTNFTAPETTEILIQSVSFTFSIWWTKNSHRSGCRSILWKKWWFLYLGYWTFVSNLAKSASLRKKKFKSPNQTRLTFPIFTPSNLLKNWLIWEIQYLWRKKARIWDIARYLFSKLRKLASEVCLIAFKQDSKITVHYISSDNFLNFFFDSRN